MRSSLSGFSRPLRIASVCTALGRRVGRLGANGPSSELREAAWETGLVAVWPDIVVVAPRLVWLLLIGASTLLAQTNQSGSTC